MSLANIFRHNCDLSPHNNMLDALKARFSSSVLCQVAPQKVKSPATPSDATTSPSSSVISPSPTSQTVAGGSQDWFFDSYSTKSRDMTESCLCHPQSKPQNTSTAPCGILLSSRACTDTLSHSVGNSPPMASVTYGDSVTSAEKIPATPPKKALRVSYRVKTGYGERNEGIVRKRPIGTASSSESHTSDHSGHFAKISQSTDTVEYSRVFYSQESKKKKWIPF